MITEKDELDQKVLCVRTYAEEDVNIWTSGKTYNAHQHRSGSWSIETDQGNIGLVPGSYLIDKFDDNFVDVTEKVVLSDVLRYCLEKGLITAEKTDGVMSLNIETEGFKIAYAFPEEDAELLPDLLENKEYAMISYISKQLIQASSGFFTYEKEEIYKQLMEYCTNVPVLHDFMEQEIEHLKNPPEIEPEDPAEENLDI